MSRRKKGLDISGWLILDKPVGVTSSSRNSIEPPGGNTNERAPRRATTSDDARVTLAPASAGSGVAEANTPGASGSAAGAVIVTTSERSSAPGATYSSHESA